MTGKRHTRVIFKDLMIHVMIPANDFSKRSATMAALQSEHAADGCVQTVYREIRNSLLMLVM